MVIAAMKFFSELFYVRNHLPVPEVDGDSYRLEIEIEGTDRNLSFSLDDLKKLPKTTIVATLMCAGNRRADMNKVLKLICIICDSKTLSVFHLCTCN